MTDKNLTHITMVLDRSGSMSDIWDDTLGGINTFIAEQKKLPGKVSFTLHWFDDKHDFPYNNTPLSDVPTITRAHVQPRGSTALLDAVGVSIDRTGAHLATLKEEDRPGAVMFVIMTDGGENASSILEDGPAQTPPFAPVQSGQVFQVSYPGTPHRALKYANDKLAKMIERQKSEYNWQFIFMGANQDAYATARAMNINASQTMNYASNSAGTASAYASISKTAGKMRFANASGASGQSIGAASTFDAEDVQWQGAAGADNSQSPVKP